MAGQFEQEPTTALVGEALRTSRALFHEELALARAELKADVKAEVHLLTGLGVAGLCGLLALNLLLTALVLALAQGMPGWLAALIVTVGVLTVGAIAGLVGWGQRVRKPFERTQRTLREDWGWLKHRLA